MVSPLKYFAAGARQTSSLILSMAGVRCDNTRVFTPASAAIRPTFLDRRVISFHMCHEGFDADRPAFSDLIFDVGFDRRHIHRLMHQNVGALRHLRNCFHWSGVAGKGVRQVRAAES